MSVVLIVGDLHLGKGILIGKPGLGNIINSRVADQIKLLDWVIEQAVENRAGCIILTGDICEEVKPDYVIVKLFIDFLKKCQTLNISVEIIAGNHDLKRTGYRFASYLDLITIMGIPNITVYKNISTIFRDGVGITLMPFRDRRALGLPDNQSALDSLSERLSYELTEIPSKCDKLLIGHLAIEGSIYVGDEFDNLSNELMCPIEMFEGYDYVWMGHVHRPQELNEEDPYVAHVGSIDTSDFGETAHSKIIIVYDTDSSAKFKEIVVPTRPLRHIPVNVPGNVDATIYVIKKIKAVHNVENLKNAIVKIDIRLLDEDSDGINREEVSKEIYNLGAFHICSLQETRNVSVITISQQHMIDNTINSKVALDIFSEQEEFKSEKEKDDFKQLANMIIAEQDFKS